MVKWEKVKLGDICAFCGKGQHPASFANEYGEYRFIVSGLKEKKCSEYDSDDEVFIIGDGGCANIHYIKGKYSASDHTYIFKSKNSTILTKYIYVYLKFNIHLLEKGFKGAGIKNLSKSYILSIEIPVIPLDIQLQIIDRLDAVSDLLEKQKQLLAEQDNLIKSIFYDMFGDLQINERKWPVKVLKDIAAVKIGPFGTLLHKEDYIYNGYPLINPTHIKAGKIQPDIKLSITQEKYDELKDYHLQKGDIVLGRRGAMGRCAVVDIENVICGTGSLIIRPNSLMMPYILQSILSSSTYRKIFEDKAVGVTMKNLSAKIVENIQIPIVPLHLQQKFSYVLERVEAQKEKIKSSIAETQTLFASLMAKYFDEE